MLTPDQPAPEGYYQNNCVALLHFVRAAFPKLMQQRWLSDQIDAYLSASDDAQRLFARLLTRKGPVFRQDKLSYREIGDLEHAVHELEQLGLVQVQGGQAADVLLAKLTKAELAGLFAQRPPGNWSKARMVDELLSRNTDLRLRWLLAEHYRWLCLARPDVWWMVRLLYFGDAVQDWSAFVLQDLGMVRYEAVSLDEQYLNQRDRFDAELRMRELSALSYRIEELPLLIEPLLQALTEAGLDRMLQRRRDKTLLRIGQHAERQRMLPQALQSYLMCTRHPARERAVRVYAKLGRDVEAAQLLEQIRLQPWCGEEQQFAARFGKRNAGFQPPTDVMVVSELETSVEQQALAWLLQHGGWGAHVENSLVRSLTGVLYWPLIFAPVPGAFTNPFQAGPNDLFYEDFISARASQLRAHEARLADDEWMLEFMQQIVRTKSGVANRLVHWGLFDEVPLAHWLAAMGVADVRKVCAYMVRNLGTRRSGLPDLFVCYGPGQYEMVEVKGPNDQLQPGQRVWMQALANMGVPCRVLRIKLGAHAKGSGD